MRAFPRDASAMAVALAIALVAAVPATPAAETAPGNQPQRLEWFRDLGFGIFIHWSVDSQIGSVISHSLVGADADYRKRFFESLPRSFDPTRFRPQEWASLIRLSGAKYVVFTAKHHSGFAMYDTRTTRFGIMSTPYGKDVTAGNLLLNIGPKPDGELAIEQQERLRELALWNFVFGESLHAVRPWVVTNEGDVWFTRSKGEDTVYAFVTKVGNWTMGERRSFTLRSVKGTARTAVGILGQTGEALEYRPDVDPRPQWRQDADGFHVTVTLAQRYYDDRRWSDPVVLKLTGVEPALTPPVVETMGAAPGGAPASAVLRAVLKDTGGAPSVEVGFQYRRKKRTEELYEKGEPWRETPLVARSSPGEYTARVDDLQGTNDYEFRAMVRHPLLTVFGEDKAIPRR